MGSVGDKAPPGRLGDLQAVGQAVELVADLGNLVPAPDVRAMAVGPLPHLLDGVQKQADPPGQGLGEDQAEDQHHQGNDPGEPQKVPLQASQKRGLVGVVLVGIDRADDLILIQHRRGCPAPERRALIGTAGSVLPQKGLHNFGVQHVAPHGPAGLSGIVEHTARVVSDQDTGQAGFLHHAHGRGDIFFCQTVQAGEGVHHHRDAGL